MSMPTARCTTGLFAALCLAVAAACAVAADNPAESSWRAVGMGGGGCFLFPAASPHDPKLIFVTSDMSGFYRSEDAGESWQVVDWRMVRYVEAPVFHPTDPSVVYLCTPDGLRISRDRGKTWTRLNDKLQVPMIDRSGARHLAIDRGNPSLMFFCASDALYRSEDTGATWSAVPGAPAGLLGVFIDQTSPPDKRVCLAANAQNVFRSNDSGKTWTPASHGLPWLGIRAFCGASDPKTGRTVVYCTIPSKKVDDKFAGGVFRSADRGETRESAMGEGINTVIGKQDEWARSDIDQYFNLAMADTDPDVVYVCNVGTGVFPPYAWTVYRTDNAGKSWRACFFSDARFKDVNSDLTWLYYDHSRGFGDMASGFCVNPSDSRQVLFVNMAEIFMTRDAGKSWSQLCSHRMSPGKPGKAQFWATRGTDDTSCWRYVFDPHDRNRGYLCFTDIGFMRSEDRGKSWADASGSLPWRNTVYDLAFDPDTPGLLWAAGSDMHDIPMWGSVGGGGGPGGISRSDDFGKTWTNSSTGLPKAPACSVLVDPASPKDKRVLYAAMFGQGVYKSVDGGQSWTQKSIGIEPARNRMVYSLRRAKDGSLFCSVAGRRKGRVVDQDLPGGLYKSTDQAESWKRITPDDIFRPVDFALHPDDPNVIYVAVMDGLGHKGGVYKTTDGGVSWHNTNVPFDKAVCDYIEGFSVALHPKDPNIVVFCTCTHGMFLSRDAAKTWAELKGPNAPPFANCLRITWDPEDPRTAYVTTFGGGAWKGPSPAP